jgi:pimeloyl-ACP methyl ester carboxylesterase
MKNPCVVGCIALLLFACAARAERRYSGGRDRRLSDYTVVSVTVDPTITHPLKKIDTVIQVGSNPDNRFTMHHVSRRHGVVKGSIILIPSAYSNFAMYMIDEKQGPMGSFAASLARAHYDVYGYSPRTANLPPRACTSGGIDCSVMQDWDLNTYVEDVEYIRAQVANHDKPVVGGLSLGGGVGLAAVNAHPSGYAGLLLWEAMLYSENPVVNALSTPTCSNLRTAIANGAYSEENLGPLLKQLAQGGETATIQFYGVPQPNSVPNWIQLATDTTGIRYHFASFPRVFDFTTKFNDVESLPVLRDLTCSTAGERTYTFNLPNFHDPILAIGGELGFGNYMRDTVDLTGSRRVRMEVDPGFGHLDAYLTSDYEKYTVDRILDWLSADVYRHQTGPGKMVESH